MPKFTVEYARTVRLKQYESLRLGCAVEDECGIEDIEVWFKLVKAKTEAAIKQALKELKG